MACADLARPVELSQRRRREHEMNTKDRASKLIESHASSKDATVRMLVSEARAMFRRGDYAKVMIKLSPASITAAREIW